MKALRQLNCGVEWAETREAGPHMSSVGVPYQGVKSSAGDKLLAGLPADSAMAFLVVQHLDPTHGSMLATDRARLGSLN